MTGERDAVASAPPMESTEAVERLPWFVVTIPGDPRYASTIRDLVVRIARGRGFGQADAAAMAGAIDGAVRHVIAVAGRAPRAQCIHAGFRAETALEVVLTCESMDQASLAAVTAEDPQRLWDREAISRVMDRVEVGHDGRSSFCRMEKRLPAAR